MAADGAGGRRTVHHRHPNVHWLDNIFRNGHARTGALHFVRCGVLGAGERLEAMCNKLGLHAAAGEHQLLTFHAEKQIFHAGGFTSGGLRRIIKYTKMVVMP